MTAYCSSDEVDKYRPQLARILKSAQIVDNWPGPAFSHKFMTNSYGTPFSVAIPQGWNCGYSTDTFDYQVGDDKVAHIEYSTADPTTGLEVLGTAGAISHTKLAAGGPFHGKFSSKFGAGFISLAYTQIKNLSLPQSQLYFARLFALIDDTKVPRVNDQMFVSYFKIPVTIGPIGSEWNLGSVEPAFQLVHSKNKDNLTINAITTNAFGQPLTSFDEAKQVLQCHVDSTTAQFGDLIAAKEQIGDLVFLTGTEQHPKMLACNIPCGNDGFFVASAVLTVEEAKDEAKELLKHSRIDGKSFDYPKFFA
jgi:hypothetical protein